MTTVTWALSVQIFVPRSDAFTVGSSRLGGSDTLGSSEVEVRDWVDLTCETGEININQGYESNSPLALYETGMCDILLKGLTYAPTLNDDVLPGVPIRVLISHPAYYSEFAGSFEDDFLVTTNPATSVSLFTGYILDAFEDREESLVKIQAVDAWHKLVNINDSTQDKSGDSWYQVMVYAGGTLYLDHMEGVDSMPIKSTDPDYPIQLLKEFDNSVPRQVISSVNFGGPYDWEVWVAYSGNVTTERLIADTPEQCVIGVGTVDYIAYDEGNPPPTDKYWRVIVTLGSLNQTPANHQVIWGIGQTHLISLFPTTNLEELRKAQHTVAGSMWVNAKGYLVAGDHNLWKWNETSPQSGDGSDVWDEQPEGTNYWIQRTIRVSDIHTGRHLCFFDYAQQTSLSSVLNSIEQKNLDENEVETITVFEDAASIQTYGRYRTQIQTLDLADIDWPGNELITQSRKPEANVLQVDVKLEPHNIDLLPELHDMVQFERDGTTQFRRVSRRNINLSPKEWSAHIEFFDYTLYEGLGI